MKLCFPHPWLATALFVFWLLLKQSVTPGQVLLGVLLAILASLAMAALRPQPVRFRRPQLIFELLVLVIADIIRSSFAVATIIISGRRDRVSGFIDLPLELTNPHALGTLAVIITATPGSTWVDFNRHDNRVLVHVLDLVDEKQWVSQIKGRYETLLLEIFER